MENEPPSKNTPESSVVQLAMAVGKLSGEVDHLKREVNRTRELIKELLRIMESDPHHASSTS